MPGLGAGGLSGTALTALLRVLGQPEPDDDLQHLAANLTAGHRGGERRHLDGRIAVMTEQVAGGWLVM